MLEPLTRKLKSYPKQQTTVSRFERWQTKYVRQAMELLGDRPVITGEPEEFHANTHAITYMQKGNPLNMLFPEGSDRRHIMVKAPYSRDTLLKMIDDVKNDPERTAIQEKEDRQSLIDEGFIKEG